MRRSVTGVNKAVRYGEDWSCVWMASWTAHGALVGDMDYRSDSCWRMLPVYGSALRTMSGTVAVGQMEEATSARKATSCGSAMNRRLTGSRAMYRAETSRVDIFTHKRMDDCRLWCRVRARCWRYSVGISNGPLCISQAAGNDSHLSNFGMQAVVCIVDVDCWCNGRLLHVKDVATAAGGMNDGEVEAEADIQRTS